ncbi:MAG TPA: OmpA family protein [Steroidobacteraceae bacterium]|nr:OmpA family protein [Steroidobacteraceae bacterium]
MSRSYVRVGVLLAALATSSTAVHSAELRFIACPVYRDTDAGRKSGCWLADEGTSGRRFDVSLAPTKPDWNHEILVEGTVAAVQDGACGGVVLNPIRVSVLPGSCTRHMLPAEGFPGRTFVLPARNVRPLAEPRVVPPPPYTNRTFYLFYDFDRSFLVYQLDDYLLDQAVTYLRAAQPKKVVVTGYAATEAAEVSGRRIAERPQIARIRAESIAESLRRLGIPAERIEVRWRADAQPIDVPDADGVREASRRRVEIEARVTD